MRSGQFGSWTPGGYPHRFVSYCARDRKVRFSFDRKILLLASVCSMGPKGSPFICIQGPIVDKVRPLGTVAGYTGAWLQGELSTATPPAGSDSQEMHRLRTERFYPPSTGTERFTYFCRAPTQPSPRGGPQGLDQSHRPASARSQAGT